MFPLFLYCTSGHCLSKSSLQLMLVSLFTLWNSENKRTYSAKVRLHPVLPPKTGLILFIIQKLFFWVKTWSFDSILKIFFIMLTLENIFRILNNSVYFQNIVVFNEVFRLLIQRYAQFQFFRKESGTSFSTTFCIWFFKKNIFHVKFY